MKLGEPEGLSRTQILCIAAILIELCALAATALFVVPHMRAALFDHAGKHSVFTQVVFSNYWVPPFVLPVIALGAFTISGQKSFVTRIVLLSACLLIGLVPIFGATVGIYLATFEAAMGEAGR